MARRYRAGAARAVRTVRPAVAGRQHGSFLSDGRIERRRVGVPVRGWSLAAQFLLGRLHGGDRVRGLMLGFRELLGVDLERLDLASQSVDLLCRRRALRGFRRRRLQL
jgi:hypothetical protein